MTNKDKIKDLIIAILLCGVVVTTDKWFKASQRAAKAQTDCEILKGKAVADSLLTEELRNVILMYKGIAESKIEQE